MLRLSWAPVIAMEWGNGLGYARSIKTLLKTIEDDPSIGIQMDEHAEMQLHFTYAPFFVPTPGKVNVLMTMWESIDMPPHFIKAFERADAVLSPATWVTEQFRKYTDKPVFTVPLGIDPKLWPAAVRPSRPPDHFRWLWVGAHNRRKGWHLVMEAWRRHFLLDSRTTLCLKTTDDTCDVRRVGNIFVDARKLSDRELLQLYYGCHGFVFPSQGEGFGLTLLEAMATGMPCVAALHTGVTEFADETVCLNVRTVPDEMRTEVVQGDVFSGRVVSADPDSLASQMSWVMGHWREARRMGARAAHRAHSQFTWRHAAVKLKTALEAITEVLAGKGVDHHVAVHT